jgi:hypothetical protein
VIDDGRWLRSPSVVLICRGGRSTNAALRIGACQDGQRQSAEDCVQVIKTVADMGGPQ